VGDIVKSVGVFRDNEVVEIDGKDCGFSYRTSNFREQDIIVYAKFDLIKADKEKCLALIDNTKALRACQPKGKSAGCIYKTEDKSAGWYIERAGLKNKRVGDIFVSPVHAGFFINAGRGTAKDMVALMDYVEKKVQDKFNKVLVREINLIGEF
jgi:UDP-N-acetylmuramate dehydrogenase